jgi:hypothetical protein
MWRLFILHGLWGSDFAAFLCRTMTADPISTMLMSIPVKAKQRSRVLALQAQCWRGRTGQSSNNLSFGSP